jgi:hypothetical protein
MQDRWMTQEEMKEHDCHDHGEKVSKDKAICMLCGKEISAQIWSQYLMAEIDNVAGEVFEDEYAMLTKELDDAISIIEYIKLPFWKRLFYKVIGG